MTEYIAQVREGFTPERLGRFDDWEEAYSAIIEHAGAEPSDPPERPPEEGEIWIWDRSEVQLSPRYYLSGVPDGYSPDMMEAQ